MTIAHLFAGVAVTDYDSARAWYERLFGRPADLLPKPNEAVWQVTDTASIYVVADRGRAGSGLLTLAVDDLERQCAELGERGIPIAQIETVPGAGRKAIVDDPDGNSIAFFEAPT